MMLDSKSYLESSIGPFELLLLLFFFKLIKKEIIIGVHILFKKIFKSNVTYNQLYNSFEQLLFFNLKNIIEPIIFIIRQNVPPKIIK